MRMVASINGIALPPLVHLVARVERGWRKHRARQRPKARARISRGEAMVVTTRAAARRLNDQRTARRRPSPTKIAPSLSSSSISDYCDDDEDDQLPPSSSPPEFARDSLQKNGIGGEQVPYLQAVVSSTFFKKRLSRQSSLPWGHRPSPLIGASCFLFALPVPLFLRACCPAPAFMLASVTVSSYLSDHVYTGLESWAHCADRVLAPLAFFTCQVAIYRTCGVWWLLSSYLALKCHVVANYHAKNGRYDQFVIWHSLWHAVGVGLILIALTYNGVVGECWEEGHGLEEIVMEPSHDPQTIEVMVDQE